jgi:hypothetical protein
MPGAFSPGHRRCAVLLRCAGVLWVSGLAVGCSDFRTCEPPSAEHLGRLPTRLSETGLYADIQTGTLEAGVRPFAPQFQLWSDGSAKRRWVWLPPGSRIATGDMDAWQFPEGTKLWKEFTRDGVRVETRLLQKVGPRAEDWVALAYVWNAEGTDAEARPGGEEDARGTPHDVPSAADCMGCHGGTTSRVLGLSAVQLSYDAQEGLLDLQDLVTEGLLDVAPASSFDVPGNDTERAALGYLHANCGHCHNQRRPESDGPRCYDPDNRLDFWLRVDRLSSPRATPTYTSAVGTVVVPGHAEGSAVIHLVSRRSGFSMPPLGTEVVDQEAVQLLRRWVDEM